MNKQGIVFPPRDVQNRFLFLQISATLNVGTTKGCQPPGETQRIPAVTIDLQMTKKSSPREKKKTALQHGLHDIMFSPLTKPCPPWAPPPINAQAFPTQSW